MGHLGKLTLFCITVMAVVTSACGPDRPSRRNSIAESVAFAPAKAVLEAKCMTCHQHASWSTMSEAEYIDYGFVDPGSTSTSQIYFRLKNFGGDMPKDAAALSATDAGKIKTWIENLE